jgi:hypothetical protein
MKTINSSFINRFPVLFPALLLAACLSAVWQPAAAAPVNSQRAATAARGWLKGDSRPLGETLGSAVQRVETFRDSAGAEVYHVVYLEPSGFVILAADDEVEPIVCFAPTGHFDPSTDNPLGALVSRDIPGRVALARRTGLPGPGQTGVKAAAKWGEFIAAGTNVSVRPNYLSAVSDVRVAPLTQTTWSQDTAGDYGIVACYNYYTPPYGDGVKSNYYSGCVATAMAQLMYYYQYPTVGVGTGTFTIRTNDVYTTRNLRGGDGSGGPYAWTNMPATPSSNPGATQCQAIGALVADAGVSVGMDYTPTGSSAVTIYARDALVNTFHYSGGTEGYNNGADLGAGLTAMINPNLDAHAPVLLGISGAGGHAVVADGYGYSGATLYHHLNLGWSGSSTAWYALPTIDTTQGTFNVVHSCVYNVYTNGSGEIISGRVLDQNSSPVANAIITAVRSGGGNYTASTDSKGIYALTRLPSASYYTLTATKANYNSASTSCSTGTSSDHSAASGNAWKIDFALSSLPTAVDHFTWGSIGNQGVGTPFSVTVSAVNTTNGPAAGFTGPVTLSASGVTAVSNVIVGSLGAQQSRTDDSWDWTDGYSITPNTNLQVVAVRAYYGTKVSIWTGTGTLLASQNVPNQPGAWVETPLATPVTLSAGSTYRIGVYYPAGTPEYLTYYVGEWPTNFPNGTVDQSLYYGEGDSFPGTFLQSGLGPFLDLRYTVPATASVAVSPTNSSTFVNGAWTGNVAVLQIAGNVVLKADDGAGHIGLSGTFNVGAFGPIRFVSPRRSSGGQFQFTLTGGNHFEIQASTNLASTNWTTLATLTNNTGTTNYTDPATDLPRRFYRAHQLQ